MDYDNEPHVPCRNCIGLSKQVDIVKTERDAAVHRADANEKDLIAAHAATEKSRRDIGLLLRQRAHDLRDQPAGDKSDPIYDVNMSCARELESLALDIEQGADSEAPLDEAVWLNEARLHREERYALYAQLHEGRGHMEALIGVSIDTARNDWGKIVKSARAWLKEQEESEDD